MLRELVALSLLHAAAAAFGVDVSSAVSESQWKCLRSTAGEGATELAVVRIIRSNGKVDTNGAATIRAAIAAGVEHVHAYIFPCVECGDAGQQVADAVEELSGTGYGRLWYDVEPYRWSDDLEANQAFITEMIKAGNDAGVAAGIYSNPSSWERIVGLKWNYPALAGLSIWYPHYDHDASYNDWRPFGGWGAPAIKQYADSALACGVTVDFNYFENDRLNQSRHGGGHTWEPFQQLPSHTVPAAAVRHV